MGERLLPAIEERKRMMANAVRLAEETAMKIVERYPESTIILIGSYGRGDFNIWSDIDILIIVDKNLPKNPLKRIDLIQDIINPNVEPHIITLEEYKRLLDKKNPYLLNAIKEGKPLIDNLKIYKS